LTSVDSQCSRNNAIASQDKHGYSIFYPDDGTTVDFIKEGGTYRIPPALPIPPASTKSRFVAGQRRAKATVSAAATHQKRIDNNIDTTALYSMICVCMAFGSPSPDAEISYDPLLHNLDPKHQVLARNQLRTTRAVDSLTVATAIKDNKPSAPYLRLEALCGFRSRFYIDAVARQCGLHLTGGDRTYSEARNKGVGHRTARQFTPATPQSTTSMLAIDSLLGMPISADGGYKHCTVIRNPGTNAIRVYPAHRNRAQEWKKAIVSFMIDSNLKTNSTIYGPAIVQSDSDSIAKSEEFTDFLLEIGAKQQLSPPSNHGNNFHAEMAVRIVYEMALSMLHSPALKGLPIPRERLWHEALQHAAYVHFLLPNKGNRENISPYQAENGRQPDILKMLPAVWGSPCSVTIPKAERDSKLAPHSRPGFFVGMERKAPLGTCRIFMPDTGRVKVTDSVLFDQSMQGFKVEPASFDDVDLLLPPPPPPLFHPEGMKTELTEEHKSFSDTIQDEDDDLLTDFQMSVGVQGPPVCPLYRDQVSVGDDSHVVQPSPNTTELIEDHPTERSHAAAAEPAVIPISSGMAAPLYAPATESQPDIVFDHNQQLLHDMLSNSSNETRLNFASLCQHDSDTHAVLSSHNHFDHRSHCESISSALILKAAFLGDDASIAAAAHSGGIGPQPQLYLGDSEPSSIFACPAVHTTGGMQLPPWEQTDPRSLTEALNTSKAKQWLAAADKEMTAHTKMGTWTLVPSSSLPTDTIVIGTQLFGKTKVNSITGESTCKMRCVARGDQCVGDIHMDDTASPVPTPEAFRCLLALSSVRNATLVTWDISTAFLHEELDSEAVFLLLPKQYRLWRYPDGEDRPTATYDGIKGDLLVGHCRRALYGLPQSCRLFVKGLHKTFASQGLKQSPVEPCLFTKETPQWLFQYPDSTQTFTKDVPKFDGLVGKPTDPHHIYIIHHVDDILVSYSAGNPDYKTFADTLQANYTCTGGQSGDSGIPFLNMEIYTQGPSIQLSQRSHIQQLLDATLGTGANCSKEDTPLPANFKPTRLDCPTDPTELESKKYQRFKRRYQSVLGQALWISCQTRPDISFSVSVLGRFASRPSDQAWKALKHLARYLAATIDLCIDFPRDQPKQMADVLLAFADSDFGACHDTSRSTSGSIHMLNGGPVSWSAKRQPLVALSTCEAETIALCSAAIKTVFLRRLLESFGAAQSAPTVIEEDNQAAIAVAESDMITSRVRHIPRRYFRVRELITGTGTGEDYDAPDISVRYCKTDYNLSDLLTKATDKPTLIRHTTAIFKPRRF
jgi:hypothetical protein